MTHTPFSIMHETNKATLTEIAQDSSHRCGLDSYYLLSRKIKELKRMIRTEKSTRSVLIWSYHLVILQSVDFRLSELELIEMKKVLSNG